MAAKYSFKTTNGELVSDFADRIKGSTILVTGVTPPGLGYIFLKQILVADPATLILAGRTPSKFESVIEEITTSKPNVTVKSVKLDLASFKSVREAAETVNSWSDVPCIDVLMNNAGVMAPPFSLTEDGIENQLQSNHLSHFLFTNLIMDKILASQSPRIISVSSNGFRFGGIRWPDPNWSDGKYYKVWDAYGQAKTANCLFAVGLAQRLGGRGLYSFSLHPGVVLGTNLSAGSYGTEEQVLSDLAKTDNEYGTRYFGGGQSLFEGEMKNKSNSVATHLYTAFCPDIEKPELNGDYFFDCHPADPYEGDSPCWIRDKIDAERLWKLSEKMVGQEFNY